MTEDVGLSVQPVQFKVGLKQLMTMVMCGFLLQQFGKFLEIIPTSLGHFLPLSSILFPPYIKYCC